MVWVVMPEWRLAVGKETTSLVFRGGQCSVGERGENVIENATEICTLMACVSRYIEDATSPC